MTVCLVVIWLAVAVVCVHVGAVGQGFMQIICRLTALTAFAGGVLEAHLCITKVPG